MKLVAVHEQCDATGMSHVVTKCEDADADGF